MMTASHKPGHNFTGWPPRPVLSLYDYDATMLCRNRAASFDLADAVSPYLGGFVRFGMSSNSRVPGRWTEAEVRRQEENIRYDLTMDGFSVEISRIKGLNRPRNEELLWELNIA